MLQGIQFWGRIWVNHTDPSVQLVLTLSIQGGRKAKPTLVEFGGIGEMLSILSSMQRILVLKMLHSDCMATTMYATYVTPTRYLSRTCHRKCIDLDMVTDMP